MEFCIIVIQVREKSGKIDYLFHILFSLSLCIIVYKVAVQFVVSKCDFVTLQSAIANMCTLPIYYASFS